MELNIIIKYKNNIQILKEEDDDYSSFKKDNKTNNTDLAIKRLL